MCWILRGIKQHQNVLDLRASYGPHPLQSQGLSQLDEVSSGLFGKCAHTLFSTHSVQKWPFQWLSLCSFYWQASLTCLCNIPYLNCGLRADLQPRDDDQRNVGRGRCESHQIIADCFEDFVGGRRSSILEGRSPDASVRNSRSPSRSPRRRPCTTVGCRPNPSVSTLLSRSVP